MPNVNLNAKLCEKFIADGQDISKEIFAIDTSERLRCFRNKSLQYIKNYLNNMREDFYHQLDNMYKNYTVFLSEQNNKIDADLILFHNNEKVNIELKFGSETNSNIGLSVFKQLFELSEFENCFPKDIRNNYFDDIFVKKTKTLDEWLSFKEIQLKKVINTFNSNYIDKKLNNNQKTILKEIINSSGSINNQSQNQYKKFVLKRGKLLLKEPIDDFNFKICPIEYKKRVVVKLINDKYIVRMILNWKNNFTKDNITVPAKLGFGSATWNIFVKENKCLTNITQKKI